ncbi:MAG: 2-oxo acid dehydrogenase subunit E2 [Chloroflexi bacterium]|nr:2-oxo acid dehydrogenase subunit E2 [Chloroflexota bacterium]
MAFEFKLPDLGEGIREAQVLTWKVTPGQEIAAFAPLCEVESAKAAVELTTPVAGRVLETRFAEGDVAHLGDVLVVIDTAAGAQTREPAIDSVDGAHAGEPEYFGIVGAPPSRPAAPAPATTKTNRVRAAPFVRKLARERGINLEEVAGSGPQGRVRIADLESASVARGPLPTPARSEAPPADLTAVEASSVILLRGLRKSIADHMSEAWRRAPQVTSMEIFDVTELVQARATLRGTTEAANVKLTYLPFFVKACIEALRAVPEANAVVDEQQQAIVLKRDFHIGIATAVPGGLVVPVVRNADRLSLLELAQEIDRLVSAARERRAAPADLSGSTFTVTSFGGLPGGALFATPILNYPEVAILGLGRIDLQPRVVEGQVVARQCIGASFTFDHRVLDGEGAGRFMATLRRYVEQPLELLLHLR